MQDQGGLQENRVENRLNLRVSGGSGGSENNHGGADEEPLSPPNERPPVTTFSQKLHYENAQNTSKDAGLIGAQGYMERQGSMLLKPYGEQEGTQARKNPLILHKGSPLEKSHTIPYIKPNNMFTSPLNQEMRGAVSFGLFQ